MRKRRHIAGLSLSVAVLLGCATGLQAGPTDFVHPGPPQVDPNAGVTPTSFDHLIPTSFPAIMVTPPDVPASSDNLVHPTDQPVVPKGTK